MVTVAAPTRIDRLVDMLELLSIQIDTMLREIAGSSLLEARRQITRDLHFEPRAEELQTIVGMAADEATEGPRHELPRKFLRLRLLADRQLKHVIDTRTLNVDTMRASGEILGDIVGAALRLEAELDRAVTMDESLNQNDRDYLLKIGDVLSCQQDELVAGSVLALRLAELAESLTQGNLEDMEPSLTAAEREHLEAFAAENITQESCRATIDAIAIRSSLERLFTAWRELGKPSEDSEALRKQRDRVLGRIRQNMTALESVSTRLQTQRDAALVAEIESLAAELQEAGRSLFSIKLQLAPVLRDPYIDVDFNERQDRPQDLRERLAASAADEAEAVAGPREASKEELYVGALKEMQGKKQAQIEELRKSQKQTDLEKQRRRMKWMVAASIVLAIASAIVNFVILP
ncbi:MAG: hypothetical protein GTN89_10115, partial [Acidobacteria bacterium]|nr:hypothetical protein [Acidobacteriota bacterium]NIM61238.1 hypothetical protein [Acidobacteriota bacterium]NIO59616.1 hypothetical protein [Acidobacteriota bacterium]NIQ30709.1 hypothetical protein [Acidobacteriota bacterium]NIT11325.1 hypothetical protein [Acidobacteriota bacterium]